MIDPLPPPPTWLREKVEPWALYFNLPALPDHIHEALSAFILYQIIHFFVSPWLSSRLFPNSYPKLNRRTKLNWDVHVVSFVQSSLINTVSLWLMFNDNERRSMASGERIYGYTGASGLVQALGSGYFLYDLIVCTVYFKSFGLGMLFHAISALWVFSFGFKPFLNFYVPNFLLYELSSPFLNIHWFLDKAGMTGSNAQWYNGMVLLVVFFSCRLIWGTWQSALVYRDMWKALRQAWSVSAASSALEQPVNIAAQVFGERSSRALSSLCPSPSSYAAAELCARANAEVPKFADNIDGGVPTWLVLTYVASNIVLNTLNYYWFSKMIDAVLKRFREKTPEHKEKPAQAVHGATLEAAGKLQKHEGGLLEGDEDVSAVSSPGEKETISSTGLDAGVGGGKELRSRKI